jgi:stress response protein YsnF
MTLNDTNNTSNLKELGESDYQIVDGESNIKGWNVRDVSGKQIGKVNELIFDVNTNKVLYLVVDLDENEFDLDDDKKVLVPIDLAELHEEDNDVILPGVTAVQLNALPAYEKHNLTPETESAVRNVFAGDAIGAATTALTENLPQQDFHQHKNFNETKFYGKRQQNTAEKTTIPIIVEKMEVGEKEVENGGIRLTAADWETFKEGTIELKEYAEIPVVSKEAFVTGEVSLEKEVQETNQTVEGTVRKTEVDTENFTGETIKISGRENKLPGEQGGSFYK